MPALHCTRKVLTELGLKSPALVEAGDDGLLGDWHVNLFRFDRRKCLIFVNERTLLSFIVCGVSRAQILAIDELFREAFRRTLASESLPPEIIERLLAEYQQIAVGSTGDRRVIGSSNNFVFHYTAMLEREGGVADGDVISMARRNNRMPILSRTFDCAIDALNGVLGSLDPNLVIEWSGRRMLLRLKERLGYDSAAFIVQTYDQIVPTFRSLPEFVARCEEYDLECFFPPIHGPGVHPIVVHVRLRSILTELGLESPRTS